MKVEVFNLTDEAASERYGDVMAIHIDGKKEFEVYDGEPEDNNLYRNFSDCFSIPDLIRKAYEAGKKGEEFDITYRKVDEI